MHGNRKLTLSTDRVLAGVCGGIADFIGWEPRAVRLLWLGLSFVSCGLGFGVYTVLAIAMPRPER